MNRLSFNPMTGDLLPAGGLSVEDRNTLDNLPTIHKDFSGVPGATEDSGSGYKEKDRVINTDGEVYFCAAADSGAAVWVHTSLTADELGAMAMKNSVERDDLSATLENIMAIAELFSAADKTKLDNLPLSARNAVNVTTSNVTDLGTVSGNVAIDAAANVMHTMAVDAAGVTDITPSNLAQQPLCLRVDNSAGNALTIPLAACPGVVRVQGELPVEGVFDVYVEAVGDDWFMVIGDVWTQPGA